MLSNNSLVSLPFDALFHLSLLTSLDLANCQLTTLYALQLVSQVRGCPLACPGHWGWDWGQLVPVPSLPLPPPAPSLNVAGTLPGALTPRTHPVRTGAFGAAVSVVQ